MSLSRRYPSKPAFLYFAPTIDLCLILIFFIILSTNFLLQPGVAVNVPLSPFALAPLRNPQVVSLTGSPKPELYFQNHKTTLDELRQHLQDRPEAVANTALIIKADRSVPYERVTAVTNLALELGISVILATDEN
ncbi:MAG: ExbD/TolR family protein [Chthoniobacterales bacterium]